MLNIRPIKQGDFERLYGYSPTRTLKGYVGELNEEPVAMVGIYFMPDQIVAFFNIKDEAKQYKRDIAKGVRLFNKLLKEQNTPVFAIADPSIPTSENLLMRCGFQYLNKGPNGEVFIWKPY